MIIKYAVQVPNPANVITKSYRYLSPIITSNNICIYRVHSEQRRDDELTTTQYSIRHDESAVA